MTLYKPWMEALVAEPWMEALVAEARAPGTLF